MKFYQDNGSYIVEYMGYRMDTGTRSFVDALGMAIRIMEPQLLETIRPNL